MTMQNRQRSNAKKQAKTTTGDGIRSVDKYRVNYLILFSPVI